MPKEARQEEAARSSSSNLLRHKRQQRTADIEQTSQESERKIEGLPYGKSSWEAHTMRQLKPWLYTRASDEEWDSNISLIGLALVRR